MHWIGVAVLLLGAVGAFVVRGGLTTPGYLAMVAGAALLAAGVVRLGRARRAARDDAYRTSAGKIAGMVAAAVYIVSPIDIIPDVFLPVGVIDDATAFAWLVFAVGQEAVRRSRARRVSRGSLPRPDSSRPRPPR
ncbi:MAG TPA: DUF1232 domain-containing protein [Thermomonospora sp.]|nr:DUF1232 domain-containing protein [Thermomonospora sp.]